MSEDKATFRRRTAEYAAAPMFWLSILFLANTAALIVLWVDIQRSTKEYAIVVSGDTVKGDNAIELIKTQGDFDTRLRAAYIGLASLAFAGCLWPIFIIEFFVYALSARSGPRFTRMGLFACFCPPLRMAAANPEMNGMLWLPSIGWTHPNKQVRARLEKVFGLPMIFIALMILPILLVEIGFKDQIAERSWLRILLHVSAGTIWFAFALEFILLCSVAQKKLQYCKDHWLDLAIILLPLLSFLRSLRAVRATRLAKLAKIQQLTKMGRMYRLRGLAVKAFRALMLFEVVNRLPGISYERRLKGLRRKLADKEEEVQEFKRRIKEVRELMAAQAARAKQEAEETPGAKVAEEKPPAETAPEGTAPGSDVTDDSVAGDRVTG